MPEFLHVLFNLVEKHSPVSFFGWNALVPLCCVHCARFDILTSFFSEAKCKPAKKIHGNSLLFNWKAHAKIQALLKENKIYPKKSLATVLRQAIQLRWYLLANWISTAIIWFINQVHQALMIITALLTVTGVAFAFIYIGHWSEVTITIYNFTIITSCVVRNFNCTDP